MSKFSAVLHRFLAAGLAGGYTGLVTFFTVAPNIPDPKKFLYALALFAGVGIVFGVEKLVEVMYPKLAVFDPLATAQIQAAVDAIAKKAHIPAVPVVAVTPASGQLGALGASLTPPAPTSTVNTPTPTSQP